MMHAGHVYLQIRSKYDKKNLIILFQQPCLAAYLTCNVKSEHMLSESTNKRNKTDGFGRGNVISGDVAAIVGVAFFFFFNVL